MKFLKMTHRFKMTEEDNFKNLCNLTTRVLGLPDGSLALKSRKRPLQAERKKIYIEQ